MIPHKYYFVVYEYQKPSSSDWERSNVVIDKHPVEWLKDMIDNFEDQYHILFYDEIEKDHYDLIDGWID